MRDILAEIVKNKKALVTEAKKQRPLSMLQKTLVPGRFRMAKALKKGQWGLIAECKLQSPAKGKLCEDHTVLELSQIYEANGAAVLSVHTDPHFRGSNADFALVRQTVKLPLLRKDFIIDPYQIYEARALGADAILLIARILSPAQLREYLYEAWGLGMDVLVEVHDRKELELALATPAAFIGINNRNLKDFTTDIQTTLALLPYADPSRMLISESGIFTEAEATSLFEAGCDGILVGEGLVRAKNPGEMARVFSNKKMFRRKQG